MRRLAREWSSLAATLALLAAGCVALWTGHGRLADVFFLAATAIGVLLCVVSLWTALRQRRPSVDVLAVLALVGSALVHEFLAGAVVAVMLATGQLLEARAQARAARELTKLVNRAPRFARVRRQEVVTQVPVDEVVIGDVVTVGSGEVTPVDGRLLTTGVFDESALTGEPLPVERARDERVCSGVVNAGSSVDLVATTTANESTYAGIVRLVREAAASTSPFVRLADRMAVYFVPLALLVAGIAWWVSGDATRAVAVLVIATPCPLLLAAPIAVMTGLSRAARSGVIVKGGAALEKLAIGRVLLLDKTGTLTRGHPTVSNVVASPDSSADEVLSLASGLDQYSPHVLAAAVVAEAHRRHTVPASATDVREVPGCGIGGEVAQAQIRVGKEDWVVPTEAPAWVRHTRRIAALEGSSTVFVSRDGVPLGAILLDDPIRPDAPRMIRALRATGITRIVMVSGDRADIADAVGRLVGVDQVYANQDPESKLLVVHDEAQFGPTIMTGDGVNDAPAMAAAGVGVALAARGSSAASEAADIVLTADRIDALADSIVIARRSRRIALVAAAVGMGLSLLGMIVAAAGLLTPTAGAILQEVIDVLSIAIALTGLIPARLHTVSLPEPDLAIAAELREEHQQLTALVERLRTAADSIDPRNADLAAMRELVTDLTSKLLPHERREEELLVPVVTRALGPDPTGALSRTHAEIAHQVARLDRLLIEIGDGPATPEDCVELRRLLYGLYAVLRLHNAQEDEIAFSLLPEPK